MIPKARPGIFGTLSRALRPRRRLSVSQWADVKRQLAAGSAKPGRWRTEANPPLREPMDCMSTHSKVRDIACMFPIQSGKTDGIALNAIGYVMDHAPDRILVALPSQESRDIWVDEKLNPALQATPAMQQALTSTASRDSANQRFFKTFFGGSIRVQHAGAPERLKSSSVPYLIVDELDAFADKLGSGDDPLALLEGRTSAFPTRYKRLYISTPTIEGVSRIKQLWDRSDQRRYYVACPHCGHEQPLQWSGLVWSDDCTHAWYACRENGCRIEEHEKTGMILRGRWVAENPGARIRGYHFNCLYYQFGLGPRWHELAREWMDAQGDPAKLKTFVNDRLAETWQDKSMRHVKQSTIRDRAEPRLLTPVPWWVMAVTSGTDTQDNRLASQIVGWGRPHGSGTALRCWPIDYVELPGDPNDDAVWVALIDYLSKPIKHEWGGYLGVEAGCIDMGGHRTEAVKNFVRQGRLKKQVAIFGSRNPSYQVIGPRQYMDVTWQGKLHKSGSGAGAVVHQVGTKVIKDRLYGLLGADHDKDPEDRVIRFSDELDEAYFGGLVSEVYNPKKRVYEPRRGAPRNEPLDTWVYAFAATQLPDVRLHNPRAASWEERESRLRAHLTPGRLLPAEASVQPAASPKASRETSPPPAAGLASDAWSRRL